MSILASLIDWFKELLAPSPLPQPDTFIPWHEYLDKLESREDYYNLQEIINRIQSLCNRNEISIAIMAIGSVLNQHGDRPYKDIDVLLLPHGDDVDKDNTQYLLTSFIKSQHETTLATVTEAKGKEWRDLFCYDVCKYWDLKFPKGKPIQIFIYGLNDGFGWHRPNLKEKLEQEENREYLKKRFSYKIINPN